MKFKWFIDFGFFNIFEYIIKMFGKRIVFNIGRKWRINLMLLVFLGYKSIIFNFVLFEIYCFRVFKCVFRFNLIWLSYDLVLYFMYEFGVCEFFCIWY